MAYSYLLNGICAKVLHCRLDERLLMLILLPTDVSPDVASGTKVLHCQKKKYDLNPQRRLHYFSLSNDKSHLQHNSS